MIPSAQPLITKNIVGVPEEFRGSSSTAARELKQTLEGRVLAEFLLITAAQRKQLCSKYCFICTTACRSTSAMPYSLLDVTASSAAQWKPVLKGPRVNVIEHKQRSSELTGNY
jgi:hypothetical protein